jgi:hypothetical protein
MRSAWPWQNNIKIDLAEIEYEQMEWIHLHRNSNLLLLVRAKVNGRFC